MKQIINRNIKGLTTSIAVSLGLWGLWMEPVRPQGTTQGTVCYIAADEGDKLLKVNIGSGSPTLIGNMGAANIEAIAYWPVTNTLYAANANTFGTLNTTTGAFTVIGTFGSGSGSAGTKTFSDVDGLTVNPATGEVYGSVRDGDGAPPNDLLIKINPATGQAITDAFDTDGNGVGDATYIVINGSAVTGYYDIDDITIDPFDGQLYAVSNQGSNVTDRFVKVNLTTGNVTLVGSFGFQDAEGMTSFNDGNIYMTTGNNSPTTSQRNKFYSVNKTTGAATAISTSPSFGNSTTYGSDYEGVACLTGAPNTISGKVFLDNDSSAAFNTGDTNTANVTVRLYRDVDGSSTVNTGDILLTTQDTNASGEYSFVVASTGAFVLNIDTADLPTGSRITTNGGINLAVANFGTALGTSITDRNFGHIQLLDYGDAPDTGVVTPAAGNYNTTNTKNGAAHLINSNLKLGTNAPDADSGTLQNSAANADDLNQTPDDEDGVTLPNTLTTASITYSATVNVTNNIGTGATLVGWIDFNKNGVFEASEGVSQTISDVTNASNVVLNWTSLTGLTSGTTYARFRISNGSLTTSTPTGLIGNGEVEDYQVTINAVDYGDAPDTGAGTGIGNYQTLSSDGGPSHTIISGLSLGGQIDADNGTLQNANADADDTTGTPDDEDGVTLPVLTASTTSYTATVNVTNTTGSNAYLVGWLDANKNGVFEDLEAVVFDNDTGTAGIQPIPIATTGNKTLTWTGLSGLTVGDTYARFRLTTDINLIGNNLTTPNPEPLTALGNGEVEDYKVTITTPVVNNPNVLLVKRITAINGSTTNEKSDGNGNKVTINLNEYENTSSPYDDNDKTVTVVNPPNEPYLDTDKWPTPIENFLKGKIDGGNVKPNDIVEYTIYFLSTGDTPAKNVVMCDRLWSDVTLVANAYGANQDIKLQHNGTVYYTANLNDSDKGKYFPAGIEPSSVYPNLNCGGPNTNGAITVDLGDIPKADNPGLPNTSYGAISFKAKIK